MAWQSTFFSDDRGAVAATYAIALTGLIIVGGAAFDYNRIMTLDSELQTAADQAALAGVTQLDQENGACARAGNAAIALLRNVTLLSNDGSGNTVTVAGGTGSTIGISDDACASFAGITFYSDTAGTVATTDETARFIEVAVDNRYARYAFTAIGGLFDNVAGGTALAGLGSAICEVPPLMICSPDPSLSFNADARRGIGVQATGGSSWAPGNFGFLEVGSGKTNELAAVIAYGTSNFDCVPLDQADDPEPGNAQVLYEALNTRLDIRPGGGGVLGDCANGTCPAAINSVTDLIKNNSNTNDNQCRLGNQGWQLPAADARFDPRPRQSGDTRTTRVHNTAMSTMPQVMGLTRDLCHYTNYGVACDSVNGGYNNRFGNGHWAIGDYFAQYHPGYLPLANPPTDASGNVSPTATLPHARMTRYETYRWEMSAGGPGIPNTLPQRGERICQLGTSTVDRRVLTVAVVSNCDALSGGSTTAVIDEWVDAFMVAPIVDENTERNRGRESDSLYLEIIGEATLGGGGGGSAGSQNIRRDKPYLVR